jgi:TRAP-type C4-dicarboxylate transport system permease large subunit
MWWRLAVIGWIAAAGVALLMRNYFLTGVVVALAGVAMIYAARRALELRSRPARAPGEVVQFNPGKTTALILAVIGCGSVILGIFVAIYALL